MHNILFTFQSTHMALKGEKYLKTSGHEIRLIPTPVEIFSECGFSVEAALSEEALEELMHNGEWDFSDCYLIAESETRSRIYEKLST